MKKVVKKNLKLEKEVIASLSENEMVKATGGGNPNGRVIVDKSTRSECTSYETGCGTRGVACGGETGYCVTIPPVSGGESIDYCKATNGCLSFDACVETDECVEFKTNCSCDTHQYTTAEQV